MLGALYTDQDGLIDVCAGWTGSANTSAASECCRRTDSERLLVFRTHLSAW